MPFLGQRALGRSSAWRTVLLSIKHAQGSNGQDGLRAEGTIGLGDPAHAPLDLQIGLTDLQLDKRLRDRTPAEYEELWDVFKPSGRVDATVHLVRGQARRTG